MHVEGHTKAKLLMGEECECTIIESWCNFDVNGMKGYGAVEWEYRNEESVKY